MGTASDGDSGQVVEYIAVSSHVGFDGWMDHRRAEGQSDSGELARHLFLIACSLGITVGLVATAGMLLAATAFATASTLVVPLVATFEGFHDTGGTNAVTVTGSWTMAGAVTIVLAILLSFLILRCLGSSRNRVKERTHAGR